MPTRRWLAVAAGLTLAATSPAADPSPAGICPAWPSFGPSPAASAGLRANPVFAGTTAFGMDYASLPPAPEPEPEPEPAVGPAGPAGRVWASGEWLYWAASGNPLPVLVTAAPGGVPRGVAGTFGGPATAVLVGGERVGNDFRSGFRLRVGGWADDALTRGFEGEFFFLGRERERFAAGGGGLVGPFDRTGPAAAVARPFVAGQTGAPSAGLVAYPGAAAGGVDVDATTEVVGGGVSYLCDRSLDCDRRFGWLLGYRHLGLRDDLRVTDSRTALPGPAGPAGTAVQSRDRFRADTDFHGAVLGADWERRRGRYFAGVRASVALGVSHQEVRIDGSTASVPPAGGPVTVRPAGLLAQPTNSGAFEGDEFAVVPEVNLRAGVQATDRLRLFAGYTFLGLSSAARAGDQIDLRVNTTLLPPAGPPVGPAVPAFRRDTTDFWLQGISLGAEVRF